MSERKKRFKKAFSSVFYDFEELGMKAIVTVPAAID